MARCVVIQLKELVNRILGTLEEVVEQFDAELDIKDRKSSLIGPFALAMVGWWSCIWPTFGISVTWAITLAP